MSQRPRFSIITVCRNEDAGIRRTCKSVVEQTRTDLEWIVKKQQPLEVLLKIVNQSDWARYLSAGRDALLPD